jgi:hypothetical protein
MSLWPSTTDRNEYKESSGGVKCGRRVRLIFETVVIENVGASKSRNPMGLHCLLDSFFFLPFCLHNAVFLILGTKTSCKDNCFYNLRITMAGIVAWRLALLQNVVMEFEPDIPFIMQFNAHSAERSGGNNIAQ